MNGSTILHPHISVLYICLHTHHTLLTYSKLRRSMFQSIQAPPLQYSCQISVKEVIVQIKTLNIDPSSRDSTVRLAVQGCHICIAGLTKH
jgi:hypothetical protein